MAGSVIEGAFEVLSSFKRVKESRDAMRAITLDEDEVFARSALALKYDPAESKPGPITDAQILMPCRFDNRRRTCGACSTAPKKPDQRRIAWPQR